MAELNLKQITDKLNSEFAGGVRKLIFWYDANAEFADDVDSLELTNARVLHLEKHNQFYIKHFLERVDKGTSYLVYAPLFAGYPPGQIRTASSLLPTTALSISVISFRKAIKSAALRRNPSPWVSGLPCPKSLLRLTEFAA